MRLKTFCHVYRRFEGPLSIIRLRSSARFDWLGFLLLFLSTIKNIILWKLKIRGKSWVFVNILSQKKWEENSKRRHQLQVFRIWNHPKRLRVMTKLYLAKTGHIKFAKSSSQDSRFKNILFIWILWKVTVGKFFKTFVMKTSI